MACDDTTTLLLSSDGKSERDVGILPRPADVPSSKKPYVFLSQTNRDDVKELYSRPVHWFLQERLGVSAFLDESTSMAGRASEINIALAAYSCTHAIVFLSVSYRKRPWCVKELNTFMKRRDKGEMIVIPVLVDLPDTTGFCDRLDSISWIKCKHGTGAAAFISRELWPQISDLFRNEDSEYGKDSPRASEKLLLEYIRHEEESSNRPVPADFRKFAKTYWFHSHWRLLVAVCLLVSVAIGGFGGIYCGISRNCIVGKTSIDNCSQHSPTIDISATGNDLTVSGSGNQINQTNTDSVVSGSGSIRGCSVLGNRT